MAKFQHHFFYLKFWNKQKWHSLQICTKHKHSFKTIFRKKIFLTFLLSKKFLLCYWITRLSHRVQCVWIYVRLSRIHYKMQKPNNNVSLNHTTTSTGIAMCTDPSTNVLPVCRNYWAIIRINNNPISCNIMKWFPLMNDIGISANLI